MIDLIKALFKEPIVAALTVLAFAVLSLFNMSMANELRAVELNIQIDRLASISNDVDDMKTSVTRIDENVKFNGKMIEELRSGN